MNKIQTATYYLGLLLCLMSGLLLEACSSDSTSDGRPDNPSSERTVRLSAGVRQYHVDDAEMASAPGLTRAVTYPSSDWTTLTPGENDNMLVFIAKETENPAPSDVSSRLFYRTSSDWQSNITITDAGPDNHYLIYGFMPIDAENVSISLLSSATNYNAGASLSIRGLKVLTQTDPCVIVGVGSLETNTSNVTLKWGTFDFTFKTAETSDVTDYMSILLDHIYSRYHFQVKIDADYAQLRTIKITKMTLEALNDAGTQTLGTVNATVNLQTNATNSNPISSVSFSPNTGARSVTLFDKATTTNTSYTNGIVLDKTKTDFQEAGFCLAPGDQRWFRLTTVYEVYNRSDKENKLIRTNTVINTFNTANFKEKKITNTNPGLYHTIQIIVNPTYLYVLSDSDLDNPPFVVNN
jgi:hypothetical protein